MAPAYCYGTVMIHWPCLGHSNIHPNGWQLLLVRNVNNFFGRSCGYRCGGHRCKVRGPRGLPVYPGVRRRLVCADNSGGRGSPCRKSGYTDPRGFCCKAGIPRTRSATAGSYRSIMRFQSGPAPFPCTHRVCLRRRLAPRAKICGCAMASGKFRYADRKVSRCGNSWRRQIRDHQAASLACWFLVNITQLLQPRLVRAALLLLLLRLRLLQCRVVERQPLRAPRESSQKMSHRGPEMRRCGESSSTTTTRRRQAAATRSPASSSLSLCGAVSSLGVEGRRCQEQIFVSTGTTGSDGMLLRRTKSKDFWERHDGIIIVALALTSRRRCCCRRCCSCRRCCCRRRICLLRYSIDVASLSRVVSRTGSLAYR